MNPKRKAESGKRITDIEPTAEARVPLLACKQCPSLEPSLQPAPPASSLQPTASSFLPPQRSEGEGRGGAHSSQLTAHGSQLTAHSSKLTAHRPAFTLTEMLIVISIIGMLAAISLGALYSARETARIAKTQATITKIDRIVQARYEEFASRRLPISAKGVAPKTMAELKFMVLCQLQQWEMPDKAEDVANPMVTSGSPFDSGDINATETLTTPTSGFSIALERSALAKRIFRRCAERYHTTSATGDAAENAASSEILYIWITCGDREAIEQFQPNEIGDTDEDGFPEFIDAWGEPIRFLRWPTCYYEVSDLMSGDADADHSEFDSRRADKLAFRLVPLIYSKGPDKKSGINIDMGRTTYANIYNEGREVGLPDGTGDHLDNITNHTLGMN